MRSMIAFAAAFALSGCAALQSGQDHAAHQAAGSAAPASAHHAQAGEETKSKHGMHRKMMAAKTPGERQAAMDECMHMMQGMAKDRATTGAAATK